MAAVQRETLATDKKDTVPKKPREAEAKRAAVDALSDQVGRYYSREGISALDFACPNYRDCSRGASDFVPAREPFIGDLYVSHAMPRLLFISLDPATDIVGRSPEARTIAAINEWESRQPRSVDGGPEFRKQAHWYQTYKFAHQLLTPIAQDRHLSPLSFPKMHRYFAHTNSAKCKDTGVGTAQAHARIFRNCSPFIPGEVRALAPDLIVTQGKSARESIAGAFPVLRTGVSADRQYRAELVDLGRGQALKFETNHPNRKDNSYRNEVADAWPWYSMVSRVFASDGADGLVSKCGFQK